MIYGENGQVLDDNNDDGKEDDDDDDSNSSSSRSRRRRRRRLLESLTAQLDSSLLARVACAFAPPPHTDLHPKDVLSATLVHVDLLSQPPQLQVAMVVPQQQQPGGGDGNSLCVQLLVPIALPPSVFMMAETEDDDDDDDEDDTALVQQRKIIDALQDLDAQAVEKIVAMEIRRDQQDHEWVQQAAIGNGLEEEAPEEATLMDGWTVPKVGSALAEECATLKSLLNEEEFAEDRLQLVRLYLLPDFLVQQARVALVCPTGLLLRAMVKDKTEPADQAAAAAAGRIVNVHIWFPLPTHTADELRARVLELVESVEEGGATGSSTTTTITTKMTPTTEQPLPKVVAPPTPTIPVGEMPKTAAAVEEESIIEQVPAAQEEATLEEGEIKETKDVPLVSSKDTVAEARKQPKSPENEAQLAAKYAAIEDLGERAYCILKDLGMVI